MSHKGSNEYTDVSTAAIEMGDAATRAPKWNRTDTAWTVSLFGTAVGAGILFLPINAGAGGVWPLLAATILIWPMTFLAHRGLSRMVSASSKQTADITEVAEEFFGRGFGKIFTLLYFLSIYPILLIYGVSITNTVDSFLTNQFGLEPLPRWLLAALLVGAMSTVMIIGQKLMLTVTQFLVYPLILVLAVLTLYLIPHWSLDGFSQVPAPGNFSMTLWLMLPVLVFSFYHAAAISQFSVAMRKQYHGFASVKASRVLRVTSIVLTVFTMGFVWSCVLAIGPDGLAEARASNLPVLSYLANEFDAPFINWLGPIVAIAAIVSSYFGHWLGGHEGAAGIIRKNFDPEKKRISDKALNMAINVFIVVTVWIAAVLNPSVLSLIESLVGPVMALVLFIVPMWAIHKVPALAPYRGKLSNIFVVISGIAAFSAVVYGLIPS